MAHFDGLIDGVQKKISKANKAVISAQAEVKQAQRKVTNKQRGLERQLAEVADLRRQIADACVPSPVQRRQLQCSAHTHARTHGHTAHVQPLRASDVWLFELTGGVWVVCL